MLDKLLLTVLCLVPWYLLDYYLYYERRYYRNNHRWCLMHTIANFIIVCVTFSGVIGMLSSDSYINSELSGHSLCAPIIVMSLHIYHICAFRIEQVSLWVHHIVMMLILCVPYLNGSNQLFLMFTDFSLFFLCGLPGMIDYYYMHLYYLGHVTRLEEKRINNLLNAYIRAPGILYATFSAYRMYINGKVFIYYAVPVILSFGWNAIFFANEVAVSYGYNLGTQVSKIE